MCCPYICPRPFNHSGSSPNKCPVLVSVWDKNLLISPTCVEPSLAQSLPLVSLLQDNLKQLIVIPSPNVLLLGRSPYCGKGLSYFVSFWIGLIPARRLTSVHHTDNSISHQHSGGFRFWNLPFISFFLFLYTEQSLAELRKVLLLLLGCAVQVNADNVTT